MKHLIHSSFDKFPELLIETDKNIFLTSELIDSLERINYRSENIDSDIYFKFFRSLIFISKLSFSLDLKTDPFHQLKGIKSDNELLESLKHIELIQFPDLKARMLDIAWYYEKEFNHALEGAILYLENALSHLDYDHWPALTERIERGLILLKSTNKIDILDNYLLRIREAFIELEGKDKLWLSYKLLELYKSFSKNFDKTLIKAIVTSIFNKYSTKEFDKARKIALILVDILKIKKEERKIKAVQIIILRLYQKEAEFHSTKQRYLNSASLIQDALDYQREIKNSRYLKKLLSKLAIHYQHNITDNFEYFTVEVDRKDIFESIDKELENADESNVYFKFIKLFHLKSKKDIISTILENRKEFAFQSLFSTTKYDHRNRVAHKYPPLPTDRNPSDEDFWPYICENVVLSQTFIGTHAVPYALHKIKRQLNIDYSTIESLVSQCWIVPKSAIKTFSRALFLGYQGDLLSFLYISTPLYEAIFRHALSVLNDEVLNQDKSIGSQSELSLGSILDHPKIQNLLTENLQIQLKVLLEDDYGIKLRHLLSHGLLNDNINHSPIAFFSFLIFNFLIFSQIHLIDDNDG